MTARVAKRFVGKVAIITGAAQGMGKQVALDLTAEGARVVICDILPDLLEETRKEIEGGGGECLALICDVTDRKQIDDMVRKTVDTFGRIDILINNAGLLTPGTIEGTTDDLIDRTNQFCSSMSRQSLAH